MSTTITTSLSRTPGRIALALVAGVGLLATIIAVAPPAQANSGWRVRQPAIMAVHPTRIEVDARANAIRFYVGDKQVAMVDQSGISNLTAPGN